MIAKIKRFLNNLTPEQVPEFDNTLAIVSLLCEVSMVDEVEHQDEKQVVLSLLQRLLKVDSEKANELLNLGMQEIKESNSVFDFTSQLSQLEHTDRVDLIRAMWEVAYADLHLDPLEEALIRKVANLIYVNHADFIRTKHDVIPA